MKTALKFLAVLFLISNFSFGQNLSQKIDSIIKVNFQSNPDVGVSIGFIHNNQEYYTAYGKINEKSQIDINKNSVFEIASITNLLTGNLLAQAVLENKIN
jgi:CubicO group peptidase (beta-lactamase class C family)